MIDRFELVADPKSKVDASKFFEIAPRQGTLPAGADRNAQATSVTVSHPLIECIPSDFFLLKITFKPTSEIHLREAEIIVVSVINIAAPLKGIEGGGAVNQSSTHIGASQSTLKGASEGGTGKTTLASLQQAAAAAAAIAPVEEEVARIRLRISAKATYSK